VLAATVGIGRFVYTPILPRMTEDLGMTKGTASLLASANFAGYFAGALVAARPVLGGLRRHRMLGGLAGSAATTAGMAFVSSASAFAVLRFAGGVASALALVFASALVLDRLNEARRPEFAALHFTGPGGGIAASAALSPRTPRGAAAGDCFGSPAVSCRSLRSPGPRHSYRSVPSHPGPMGYRRHGAAGASRRWRLPTGFSALGTSSPGRFSSPSSAGRPRYAFSSHTSGSSSAFPGYRRWFFWTSVGERIGISQAFAIACVAEAAGVVASVLWTTPAGVFVAAGLFGGTIMGITALGLIAGRRLTSGDPRGTLAILTAVFGIGQIVGPAFAGAVYDTTGSFVLPSMAAAGALLLGALLVVVG
jgi:predicted MFS family arabinose efflux permease